MANRKRGKAAKIVVGSVGLVALGLAGTVSAMAYQYVPLIAPGTIVAGVPVGGLTKDAAAKQIEEWWKSVESRDLSVTSDDLLSQPLGFSAQDLGVHLDVAETVQKLPLESFWDNSARKIQGKNVGVKSIEPELVVQDKSFKKLAEFVNANVPEDSQAKVDLVGGKIVRTPERVGLEFDPVAAEPLLRAAVVSGEKVDLPLKKAKARITDEELSKITEVVSTYTTRYNEGNANRSHNIKNAAMRLSGTILMPGETFSFNKVLGQRTAKNGFKLAGVYNNGRHDFDIGGGICQVSSTLYNSVLLANLKVAIRSCHTFPVPYVPVGRDATVSFPAPDFAFTNSYATPIALSTKAGGGSITFSILGMKQDGLEVKIESVGHTSWSRPVKEINDPSLPPGRRVVEEKGGAGHRITTYRVVYQNGQVVERQNLGVSLYNGGSRIVRVNKKAPAAAKPVEVPGKVFEDESPDAVPPTMSPDGPPTTEGDGS